MCVCMCACMYVCMHVHTYLCTYALTYIFLYPGMGVNYGWMKEKCADICDAAQMSINVNW